MIVPEKRSIFLETRTSRYERSGNSGAGKKFRAVWAVTGLYRCGHSQALSHH